MAIQVALLPFHAARIAVVVAALAAPLAAAAVLGPRQPLMWLSAAGIAIGLAGGRLAGPRVLAALVAAAPLWQVLVWWATGSNDFNLVMPWLAAVAGCLAAMAPARWQLDRPWLVPVAAWALIVAVAWPVTAARELDFTVHSIGGLTGNGRMAPPPSGAAAAVAMAAEIQLVALLLFDWMIGAADGDRRRLWRWLAPGVGLACVLAIVQMTIAPQMLSREPWIRLGRAAGPFWDANAMGSLAALFGPALAAGAGSRAGDHRVVTAALWSLASLGAVLASGSRTALVAWVVATAVGVSWQWRSRRRLVLGAAGGVVVVGLVLATASTAVNPYVGLTRLVDTVRAASAAGGAGLYEVVGNRDGYGAASVALIAEHPWAGIGPGAFNLVILDFALEALGIGLPADNAQNWWRHQWAEIGLAGAAAGLACSLLAALTAWRLRQRPDNGWALPIVALGLMCLVSSPVQHPFIQVLVGVLLGGAVVAGRPDQAEPPARPPAWAWGGVIWIVAGLCASTLAIEGWRSLRPPYRAVRYHFPFNYGIGEATPTAAGDARWAASRAVAVIAPGGRTLALHVTVPPDVAAPGPVPVTLSDRDGPVCGQTLADGAALDCRITVPQDRWILLQIAVGRPLARVRGTAKAAYVTGRFEK